MLPNLGGGTLSLKHQLLPGEPHARGRTIIVDPRRTSTVAVAEAHAGKNNVLHLQINNGTDIALLNALHAWIRDQGWQDQDFINQRTNNFGGVPTNQSRPESDEAVQLTGISKAQNEAGGRMDRQTRMAARRRTLFLYEKGLIWGSRTAKTWPR